MGLDKFFILTPCTVADSTRCLRTISSGVGTCGMKKTDVRYVMICSFMLFLADVFITSFGTLKVTPV